MNSDIFTEWLHALETNISDFRSDIVVGYRWGDSLRGLCYIYRSFNSPWCAIMSAAFSWLVFLWYKKGLSDWQCSPFCVENQRFQLNCCPVSWHFIFNIYDTFEVKQHLRFSCFCGLRAHSFPALLLLCPVHVFISACLNVATPCARCAKSSGPLLFKCQCQRSSEAALCTSGPVWPLLYLADAPICFHSQAPERVWWLKTDWWDKIP